jgi:hypothetical protein
MRIHDVSMFKGVLLWSVMAAGCAVSPWQAEFDGAEEARELAFLTGVDVIEMTREEFAARAEERASNIDEEALRALADTYGRLGYFDMNLDLRPVIAGASSDWVGATYSPSSKKVTLVGEAGADVLVHEFVHALQDQHFDIRAYDRYDTSDAFLSRRAVVEGDAVLAQYRFLGRQQGVELDALDWQLTLERWRQRARDILVESTYPMVFLDYVSFVYAYGLEYSAANLLGVTYDAPQARLAPHDWNLQNELFVSRPPATTQQVLDRDLHGENQAVDPVIDVGLRQVPISMQEQLVLVDWDTLGEWYVYLLFLPLELDGAVANAAALASAWDGDAVLFARDQATGQGLVVWTSIWDDEQAAGAIALAMRALHGAAEPVEGYVSTAADGELLWVEQRGDMVVAAKNVPEALAQDLVEQAFASRPGAMLRLRPSLGAALERLRPMREAHHPGVFDVTVTAQP